MNFTDDNFRFYCLTRQKLGVSASQCLQELQSAYGSGTPGRSTVFRWYANFRDIEPNEYADRSEIVVDRPRSGRPRAARCQQTVQVIKDAVADNPRITIRELAALSDVSLGTVSSILHEDLQLRNVTSVWVPHVLSEANRQARVNCAKHLRRLYSEHGIDGLCDKLAVQDETWIFLEGKPSKQQNRCWLTKNEPRHHVVRPKISDKKVMLLFAFTPNGRFSLKAIRPGETVDSECIIQFIKHTGDLWRSLRSRPIRLSELLWQWDNARPHTSRQVQVFLEQRNITKVFQSPYSPDLNLCDRFVFMWLKSDFSTRRFEDFSDVEEAALRWTKSLNEDALRKQVQKLIDYCQLVIESGGEYVTDV